MTDLGFVNSIGALVYFRKKERKEEITKHTSKTPLYTRVVFFLGELRIAEILVTLENVHVVAV